MITAIKIMLSTAIAAVVPAKTFVLRSCWLPSPGVMLGVEVSSTVCRRVLVVLTVTIESTLVSFAVCKRVLVVLTAIAAVVSAKMFVLRSCLLGVMLGLEVGSIVCRRVLVTVDDGSMLLVG